MFRSLKPLTQKSHLIQLILGEVSPKEITRHLHNYTTQLHKDTSVGM